MYEVESVKRNQIKKATITSLKLARGIKNQNKDEPTSIIISKKSTGPIEIKVSACYDDENVKISSPYKFTMYDKIVYDAVCSLYIAGNKIMTPDAVYRVMNGLRNSEKVSEKAIKMIDESVDKCSRTQLTINFINQEALRIKKGFQKAIVSGYMLAVTRVSITISGITKIAYKILDTPILYDYSKQFNQVITIPLELLNTKEVISSTPKVTIIRQCLLNSIETEKKKKNKRNKLSIDYGIIYDDLEIDKDNKKQKADVRKIVKQLLDYYEKINYIKKYEETVSTKYGEYGCVSLSLA